MTRSYEFRGATRLEVEAEIEAHKAKRAKAGEDWVVRVVQDPKDGTFLAVVTVKGAENE